MDEDDECAQTRRVKPVPVDAWTPDQTKNWPKSPEAALEQFLAKPPKADLGGVTLDPDPAVYEMSLDEPGHTSFTSGGTSIEAFTVTNCTDCWWVSKITVTIAC